AARAAHADTCGAERQAVKVGADVTAGAVRAQPQDTTIAELTALAHPRKLPARRRVMASAELAIWRVRGWITAYKSEADGDVHVVLADADGHTMIIEFPSEECSASGRWAQQIAAARTELGRHLQGARARGLRIPVTVTGVGFFDRVHGQLGVAPNGI